MRRTITPDAIKAIYHDMFWDDLDDEVAEELASMSYDELNDIAENNDAECSYSPYSAGQVDCAIAAYEA